MILKLVNKIIQKLGKDRYEIDNAIKTIDLLIILNNKLIQLIRGFWLKMFLGNSKGILFIGRRCKIRHKNHISFGKTAFIGDNVEIFALSKNGIKFGNNVSIHRNSIIDCTGGIRSLGEGLIVGNNVGFSPNCFIQVRGTVKIGDNVIFGPGVKIFSETHNFYSLEVPILQQGETRIGVVIEDNVWVGADVIILDGVKIGKESIIAAGTVVNKTIEPYSIIAGVPGKLIKKRINL
jgi:acetyltransferase-like isoleucine patch superfamily enzyme